MRLVHGYEIHYRMPDRSVLLSFSTGPFDDRTAASRAAEAADFYLEGAFRGSSPDDIVVTITNLYVNLDHASVVDDVIQRFRKTIDFLAKDD